MAQKLNKDLVKYYSYIAINKTKRAGLILLFCFISSTDNAFISEFFMSTSQYNPYVH